MDKDNEILTSAVNEKAAEDSGLQRDDIVYLSKGYVLSHQDEFNDFNNDLLKLIHEQNEPYKAEELSAQDRIAGFLSKTIDWETLENATSGEDVFFDGEKGLYTSMKESFRDLYSGANNDYKAFDTMPYNWDDAYWNKAISKMIQDFYQKIDIA